MEVGARVWVRDKRGEQAWLAGCIVEKNAASLAVEVDDDEYSEEPLTFPFREGDGYELDDVKLANEAEVDTVDDLIQLPHLHEAAILHSLTTRFDMGQIYTFTANAILLAVNPFQRLPLYTRQILQEYHNLGCMRSQGIEPPNTTLGPHVFAIADSAYRDMMHGIHLGKAAAAMGPVNQSILISGESGAGKTESTKIVMKYLTTVGNEKGMVEAEEGSTMDKVMESNPILEAFGNARTIRNDNSSRFGKFIELMFDKRGNLLGAGIETYLLEKVRIPNQSADERNFHIFYQMTKGADDEERERWALAGPEDYHYCNQGDCYDLRQVEDEEEFALTKKALNVMGFGADSTTIFDCVAGVLHLGQMQFVSDAGDDGAVLSPEDGQAEILAVISRLCCLPPEGLIKALTTKTLEARGELTTMRLHAHQAMDARDALAKALYGRLFDFIVSTINANIACERKDVKASVGVLDIFGFECFVHNSFEQLCINYTNETLQQQFNQFVFKMEQKEYTKEGIEWSFIEFPDNQDCLDLIEGRPKGLMAMLDDECRMGIRGTDSNYASRLYKEHTNTARFVSDDHMKTTLTFGVRHYAGLVVYGVNTFCEKNRDELPKESDDLFQSSSSEFIRVLFGGAGSKKGKKPVGHAPRASAGASSSNIRKPTVSTNFKEQLHALMEMIRETRPHYIRCVKPNDQATPELIHRARVMEQLRYGGVLEAVRVARSGYPVRMPHRDFYSRYRLLSSLAGIDGAPAGSGGGAADKPAATAAAASKSSAAAKGKTAAKKKVPVRFPVHMRDATPEAARSKTEELVKQVLCPAVERLKGIPADTVQFGKTKVFLRKNAHDTLEMLRSRRLSDAAVTLQRIMRGFVYRRVYRTYKGAALTLQRVTRGMIARLRANRLRRCRGATWLQKAARRFVALMKFQKFRRATISLQSRFRGRCARQLYKEMRRDISAVRLQAWGRQLPHRRRLRKLRSAVVALQCAARLRKAKAEYKHLRTEAKDVGNLKRDNEKLKEDIRRLREQAIKAASDSAKEEVVTAKAAAAAAEGGVKTLSGKVMSLEARIRELEAELELEKEARAVAEAAAAAASEAKEEALAAAASAAEAGSGDADELRMALSSLQTQFEFEQSCRADAESRAAITEEAASTAGIAAAAALAEEQMARAAAESAAEEARIALSRAVEERERAEEMAARLSTSLRERKSIEPATHASLTPPRAHSPVRAVIAEEDEAEDFLDVSEDTAATAKDAGSESTAALPLAREDDDAAAAAAAGENDNDGSGLNNDDLLISNLVKEMGDEREKRRRAEEEKTALKAQLHEAEAAAAAREKELTALRAAAAAHAAAVAAGGHHTLEAAGAAPGSSEGKQRSFSAHVGVPPLAVIASPFSDSGEANGGFWGNSSGRVNINMAGVAGPPPGHQRSRTTHRTRRSLLDGSSSPNAMRSDRLGSRPGAGAAPAPSVEAVAPPALRRRTESTATATTARDAVFEFEERLDSIKRALGEGVEVLLWEGKVKQSEALLKLEQHAEETKLTFSAKGSYMIWRNATRGLTLDESVSVRLGHGGLCGLEDMEDDSFFSLVQQATLATTPGSHNGNSEDACRAIVLRVADKQRRNDMVSGLRKLLTEISLGAMAAETRTSKNEFHRIAVPDSTIHAVTRGGADAGAGGAAGGNGRPGAPRTEAGYMAKQAELELNLKQERMNYERLMVQMLEQTNDVNAKEDEVRNLKRELADVTDDIAQLRRAHKDNSDAMMQLCKKLEHQQFDNEELKQENEVLRTQVRAANALRHERLAEAARGSGADAASGGPYKGRHAAGGRIAEEERSGMASPAGSSRRGSGAGSAGSSVGGGSCTPSPSPPTRGDADN